MRYSPNSARSTELAIKVRDGTATEEEREEWGSRTLAFIEAKVKGMVKDRTLDECHADDIIGDSVLCSMERIGEFDNSRGCWNTFLGCVVWCARKKYFRELKKSCLDSTVDIYEFVEELKADLTGKRKNEN